MIRKLMASGLGVGYFPIFPGTMMSLVTAIALFYAPEILLTWSLIIVAGLFFLGVYVSGCLVKNKHNQDPSWIVIDELVGMWIALLVTPKTVAWYAVAFSVFRVLDISKACGVSYFERFRGGWGIMLDDVAAGTITLLIVQLLS